MICRLSTSLIYSFCAICMSRFIVSFMSFLHSFSNSLNLASIWDL